ncbi:hypothetical protein [Asanoa iriomotensis]|uniref:KAP-like P-loop domain-containing protein n=1 Tax=Asanoa iriomotensis TaxID=234613 RepID=A0ABQ4CA27_9ACTN|nr:hypothetical protein [Asanoa iriomotensis]GIF59594.1 hypothetical protein Air01nite_56890 [Asanoa iriomotensis]
MTQQALRRNGSSTRYRRMVLPHESSGWRSEDKRPVALEQPVSDYLARVAQGVEPAFRCIAVGAARHDGVTWAREDVEQAIAEHDGHPRPRLTTLAGAPSEGGLPKIFDLFRERTVARAARRAGAANVHSRIRSWLTLLIIAVAIVITAVISLFTPEKDPGASGNSAAASLLETSTLVNALILAALGVAAQVLIAFVKPAKRVSRSQRIVEWIEREQGSRRYQQFVDQLAAEFANIASLRCLVVDDFGLLDKPTRDLLVAYLGDGHASDRRPELWVVFDPSDDPATRLFRGELARLKQASRVAGERRAPYGVRRTLHYELAALTDDQRHELAHRAGRPERAGYRTVKAILTETDDTLTAYFEQQIPPAHPQQDPERYGAFQLLYLLGQANSWSGAVELPEAQLIKKLAEHRQRSRVLREVLTGPSLSRNELTRRLKAMRTHFARVVTEIRQHAELRLAVSVEAGETLERVSGRFRLASADLGHLFWALYRDDNRAMTADDPFWLGKLAQHLQRAAAPRDRADIFGADAEALEDRLFQAILHAIDDSLRLGQLRLVPDLLQRALDLLDEEDAKNRASLAARARDAYAVMADDVVLQILLELRTFDGSGPPLAVDDDEPDATSPLGLFALASTGGAQQQKLLAALAPSPGRADLHTDAALRGSWLALSLLPFVQAETPQLFVAAIRGQFEVASLTKPILDARSAEPRAPHVADLVNLSLGLWCWALAGAQGGFPGASLVEEIIDALETSSFIASELRTGSPRGTVDLVRECLAEELFTVTAAAALLVRAGWPNVRADVKPKLDEVVRYAVDELGIDARRLTRRGGFSLDGAAGELFDRMTLLQMTWRVLGYAQLATVLNIRRVQFAALLPAANRPRSSAEGAERSLIEDRDRSDLLGLLANLAAAARAVPGKEAAAEAFAHGVTAALVGRASEELLSQLCLLAVAQAHAFETELGPQIEYLLGGSAGGGSRLDELLSTVDDAQLPTVSLWLFNIARRSDAAGLAVVTALMRRGEAVTDEEVLAQLRDRHQIFDLVGRQSSGEAVDVDQVLDLWENRDSTSYPFLLYRLVGRSDGPLPARLRTEVAEVLADYESYLSTTGVVLLAALVAQRSKRRGPAEFDEAQLVTVLRRGRAELSSLLTVETNIEILEYLRGRDISHGSEYTKQLTLWRQERLRLLEERQLTQLLMAGRYAMLLLTYLEILEDYGLPTGDPDDEGDAEPFLTVQGRTVLNSRFVAEARALFDPSSALEGGHTEAHNDLDDAAREALPQLFAFLVDLDGVPEPIRVILRRHRDVVHERLTKPVRTDPSMHL